MSNACTTHCAGCCQKSDGIEGRASIDSPNLFSPCLTKAPRTESPGVSCTGGSAVNLAYRSPSPSNFTSTSPGARHPSAAVNSTLTALLLREYECTRTNTSTGPGLL